jgi:hypothetical protein
MNGGALKTFCTVFVFVVSAIAAQPQRKLPSLAEVENSKLDLWGEAALREPDGASYEFFAKLLPPPRYVNADFRYYPIVLSAPNAKEKARLISNGSGVNLRGGSRSWHEVGTPVIFRVGPDEFRFGDILNRLQHPKLAEGYLPIVQIDYAHPTPRHDNGKAAFQSAAGDPSPEVYRLEAFASTDPKLAENAVVFVTFSLAAGASGVATVELDSKFPFKFMNGKAVNEKGETLAWFDRPWDLDRQLMHAKISTNKTATLAIATKPLETNTDFHFSKESYIGQRQQCIQTWKNVLSEGMNFETPEPLVNAAWKNLIIQQFSICGGSNLYYSAGNQYQKLYAAETSDAAVPLMAFGYERDMRRFLPVILNLVDRRLTNHFAAHKLDTLCRFYWQTRDAGFVKAMRPRWQAELDWVMNNRGEHGLLPKDNYCTDIERPVYSFSSNAKCWAALRDIIPVLEEIGDHEIAARVAEAAPKYKESILAAVDKSIRRDTDPPFVPCALFGAEDVHDPITETRIGSYWDLVANYIVGSGVFSGTERETWIPKYFETHGGLCMGLTRSAADNHTFWTGKHRTNPLYGMRYLNDCLRRDDVERALVGFYGMLAHGMTRNTFIGAEGCSIEPLDEGGRFFYCPPNTASNGQWLWTLRHLLVQDFDLDNDGKPETLRLAFATPKQWLEDGKIIKVERAPTAFGPMAMLIQSKLSQGEVIADIDLPQRNAPEKILLRARVPDGWKVVSAQMGNKKLPADERGTVDLTALENRITVRFAVARN